MLNKNAGFTTKKCHKSATVTPRQKTIIKSIFFHKTKWTVDRGLTKELTLKNCEKVEKFKSHSFVRKPSAEAIHNTVVQSIELPINRGASSRRRHKSSGTGIFVWQKLVNLHYLFPRASDYFPGVLQRRLNMLMYLIRWLRERLLGCLGAFNLSILGYVWSYLYKKTWCYQ